MSALQSPQANSRRSNGLAAVTGLGLCCSLGSDVENACAAIRADLTRPTGMHFETLDSAEHEMTPVIGHAAQNATQGLAAPARWVTLCRRALEDLGARAGFPPESDHQFWAETRMAIATPVLNDSRFRHMPECSPQSVWPDCLSLACTQARIPIAQGQAEIISCGSAGVVQALIIASTWLSSRETARVIVLTVDSLLDAMSLLWLEEHRRLKCDENPVGLAPGEAACAILLEAPSAENNGLEPLAIIKDAVFEPDGTHFLDIGERRSGLATVTRRVLESRHRDGPFRGELIADLNGETWRAQTFGTAVAAIPSDIFGDPQLWVTAAATGDAGVGNPAIGIATAVQAFVRNYSSSDESVVLAFSETGQSGAIILQRPDR